MARKGESGTRGGHERYFLLFDLCTLAFLAWVGVQVSAPNGEWALALNILWIVLLVALFSTKRRDEFAQHCWRGATDTAFTSLLIAPLVWAFTSGLVDGLRGRDAKFELTVDGLMLVVFAIFFAAFQWRRFRGGAG